MALTRGEPATALGLEFRYALMAASVAGLDAHVPGELVSALSAAGVWDAARMRAHPGAHPQAAAGTEAVPAGSGQDAAKPAAGEMSAEQRRAVLAEQVTRARRVRSRDAKLRALAGLLPRLDADERFGVLAEAVTVARSFPAPGERAAALAGLAPYLSAEVLAEVLALAGQTTNAAFVLSRIVAHLPSALLPAAVAAARRLTGSEGAQALAAVVPLLALDQRPVVVAEALAVLHGITDWSEAKFVRPQVLGALAPFLPVELVEEALGLAGGLVREYGQANALTRMASGLPAAVMPALLARAGRLVDRRLRAGVVAAAAGRLPYELLPSALAVVRGYHDEPHRAATLAGFAPYLPADDRSTLLAAVLTAGGPATGQRAAAWAARAALATCLPAELRGGLVDAIRTLADPYDRAWALASLAVHLPDVQRRAAQAEALADAADVDDDHDGVPDLVRFLAPQLPVDLLRLAFAMDWRHVSADVFAALVPHLPPDLVGRALESACGHYREDDQARMLRALAPHLPADLVPVAVFHARRNSYPPNRGYALEALAPRLSGGLVAELLADARAEQERGDRVELVIRLAPALPADERLATCVDAVADARAEPDPARRARLLALLVPVLPADLHADVVADLLAAAGEARKPADATPGRPLDPQILERLLEWLPPDERPPVLAEALSGAAAMPTADAYARRMVALAPHLPADRHPEILAAVAGLANPHECAENLEALAPVLPAALLAEALAAAAGTENWSERPVTALLRRAYELWCGDRTVPLVDLVRQALHHADRMLCLSIGAEIAPIVNDLGGATAVVECVEAIRDVQRWWP